MIYYSLKPPEKVYRFIIHLMDIMLKMSNMTIIVVGYASNLEDDNPKVDSGASAHLQNQPRVVWHVNA